MSRLNQENAYQEDALSDTLGAVLLISVVVMAVTLAGVAILSQPHAQKIPAINADITTIDRAIVITHNGGDGLLRSEVMIVVDGSDLTSSFRKTDGTPWSSWVIGDSLVYTVPQGQPMPRGVTIFYIGGSSAYIIQSVGVPQAVIMSGMSPSVTPTPVPSFPVTAGFGGTPVSGNIPLTVQFTDQSTGPVTSWSWSFGDGGTSTAKNPAYTYPNPGLYTVQLTVSNGTATDTMTKTGYILAVSYVPGLLANYYSDQSWTVPAATNIATRVHFADKDASGYASDVSSWPVGYIGKDDHFSVKFDGFIKIDTADDYTFYLTSDDGSFMDLNGTSFINNGGDHGPATVTATKHLTPGYYPVSVRMYENAGGAVAYLEYSSPNITRQVATPLYHILATPPVPGFAATPTGGPAPLAVQFTDTSTDGPTAWTWDFGDGTPVSHLQNPAHTYTANGNYNVSLVAINGFGSNTLIKTGYIIVASYSPGILANYYSDQSWTVPAATNVATRVRFADTASGYASDVTSWPVGYIGKDDHFSVKFDGFIKIDTTDDYTFYLTSDDGSFMDLDGTQLINNGGDHGPVTVSSTVHLTPGYHPVSVRMYENAGGAVVYLEYSTPSTTRQLVTSLYHIPTTPPTPDFSATPRAGPTPLAVQFTDMSVDATSWSWDFGDGSPASTTQNPAHTYAANGDYNVSLVATNSYGSNTVVKNNYITVRSFVPGLNATYYLGQNWLTPAGSRTDNEIRFADAEGVAIGEVTDEVNWPNSITGRQDDFSVQWDGYLRVTTADTYTFSLRSDDGSQFWIDEGMLIDNSGLHSPRTYTGTVALIPGYHHIVVRMFENTGQAVALLQYSSPSMPLQQVTDVWQV